MAATAIKFGTSGWRSLRQLGQRSRSRFVKVGSFDPQRENLRLTADAKEKSTEKLQFDPSELTKLRAAGKQ